MDAYLLPINGGSYFLYTAAHGLAAPNERRGLLRRMADFYRWLTRRSRLTERVVRSFDDAELVRVIYPSTVPPSEAERAYEGSLRAAASRHKKWVLVDGIALLMSLPLTLVPGPNLVLAFLGWRVGAHFKARRAALRALDLPVELVPNDALVELEGFVRSPSLVPHLDRIRALGERLGVANLDLAYWH